MAKAVDLKKARAKQLIKKYRNIKFIGVFAQHLLTGQPFYVTAFYYENNEGDDAGDRF